MYDNWLNYSSFIFKGLERIFISHPKDYDASIITNLCPSLTFYVLSPYDGLRNKFFVFFLLPLFDSDQFLDVNYPSDFREKAHRFISWAVEGQPDLPPLSLLPATPSPSLSLEPRMSVDVLLAVSRRVQGFYQDELGGKKKNFQQSSFFAIEFFLFRNFFVTITRI